MLKICLFFCYIIFGMEIKSFAKTDGNREKVILLLTGTFNPPTIMHLRIFETARDYLRDTEKIEVVGGIISPIHEQYQRGGIQLASNGNRREMIWMSILSSDWIRLSEWQMQQPTLIHDGFDEVLTYHQNYLDSVLSGDNRNIPSWLLSSITEYVGEKIRIKLICGTDVLELIVNKRKNTHIIRNHGLIVVTRGEKNARQLIFDNDQLFQIKDNITIIDDWVPTKISSTMVRLYLRRGLSVKYFINDDVNKYIYENNLYDSHFP